MAAILLGVSLAVNLLQLNLSNGQCNRNLISEISHLSVTNTSIAAIRVKKSRGSPL